MRKPYNCAEFSLKVYEYFLKYIIDKKYKSVLTILFFLISILLIDIKTVYPQTRVDSLEYLGRYFKISLFNTRFDKQLNTFYLNSMFQLFEDYR